MEPLALSVLLASCAPQVHPSTAAAIVATESSARPFAIGIVGGQLDRQPASLDEAISTASALRASGWDFSVGLAQINQRNLSSLGLSLRDAFDPCRNLAAMQSVLSGCYRRASAAHGRSPGPPWPAEEAERQVILRDALSCYYSGNFTTGHHHGYVQRVVRAAPYVATRPP